VDDGFEVLVVAAHDDVAEHVDEPAIDVVRESCVSSFPDDSVNNIIIQTKIQYSVHHSRHRYGCPATDADEQRAVWIAELSFHHFLQLGEVLIHLLLEPLGPLSAGFIILTTHLRGDRKSRRHRHAQTRHLRKIRTLTAQKLLHLPITFGLTPAEEVHSLVCH